uniref:Pentatricopeptide repeat domain 1 n=1 Tax=Scophthalmus maximus TaxID=52904 RepID=A0A8D2ZD88_SCOMX
MLTSAACLCVRNGGRISAPVAMLSLGPAANAPRCLSLTWARNVSQRQRSPGLRTPTPRCLSRGATLRSVSLSAASPRHVDPRAAAPRVPEEGDRERFGSLSGDISSRRSFRKSGPDLRDLRHREDEEEGEEVVAEEGEEALMRRPGRRNTPYWYHLQCRKLIKDNKLQEALDLFSRDMLRVERLQPEEYNYTVLIGGCGRAGRLKQAFRLYNDMKKRGLDGVDATYTALFNACAESPLKQAGLQQALVLEQELLRKNIPLSTITYQALLKTHAFTNNLQACIHTLREMLEKGHVLTQKTFHYLLMGCLKDKDNGFRLALQVWRQMLKSGIRPDSKNYNLLLRTARDCGIGDPALASSVLLSPEWGSRKVTGRVSNVKSESGSKAVTDIELLEKQLFIEPDSHRDREESNSRQESTQLIPVTQMENASLPVDFVNSPAPNLLDVFEGRKGDVVSLGTVDKASDRLALIGGAEGFLEKLAAKGLSPDLKTLTLLADMMESSYESLQMLLRAAKQHQVKLDVGFFNSAIRRSARAGDLEAAKGVLTVMRQRNVSVDVKTFGSLALGCERQSDCLQLLKDMEEAGLRPNVHVFSALIGQATRRLDYVYLKTILKSMSSLRVWPNKIIIQQLEFASQYPPNYNQVSVRTGHDGTRYKSRNNYLVQIDGFRGFYQQWLRFMPAQDDEGEQVELQTETDAAEDLKTDVSDELTQAQRNQRAAARRFGSHKKDKTSITAP